MFCCCLVPNRTQAINTQFKVQSINQSDLQHSTLSHRPLGYYESNINSALNLVPCKDYDKNNDIIVLKNKPVYV